MSSIQLTNIKTKKEVQFTRCRRGLLDNTITPNMTYSYGNEDCHDSKEAVATSPIQNKHND